MGYKRYISEVSSSLSGSVDQFSQSFTQSINNLSQSIERIIRSPVATAFTHSNSSVDLVEWTNARFSIPSLANGETYEVGFLLAATTNGAPTVTVSLMWADTAQITSNALTMASISPGGIWIQARFTKSPSLGIGKCALGVVDSATGMVKWQNALCVPLGIGALDVTFGGTWSVTGSTENITIECPYMNKLS